MIPCTYYTRNRSASVSRSTIGFWLYPMILFLVPIIYKDIFPVPGARERASHELLPVLVIPDWSPVLTLDYMIPWYLIYPTILFPVPVPIISDLFPVLIPDWSPVLIVPDYIIPCTYYTLWYYSLYLLYPVSTIPNDMTTYATTFASLWFNQWYLAWTDCTLWYYSLYLLYPVMLFPGPIISNGAVPWTDYIEWYHFLDLLHPRLFPVPSIPMICSLCRFISYEIIPCYPIILGAGLRHWQGQKNGDRQRGEARALPAMFSVCLRFLIYQHFSVWRDE